MRMKYVYVVFQVLLLVACQEKTSPSLATDAKTTVDAVQIAAPTTPEETEVYQPVPPVVSLNEKGIPNDAIVLFDGSHMDEWIAAKDSTAANWILNADGSMTVKDLSGDCLLYTSPSPRD